MLVSFHLKRLYKRKIIIIYSNKRIFSNIFFKKSDLFSYSYDLQKIIPSKNVPDQCRIY